MTSSQLNQQNYNIWSDFYDKYPNPTVAIDEMSFPDLYAHFSGMNILEIGCGTGRHTTRLIEQSNKVLALDVSDGMLQKAKSKIKSEKATFLHADFLVDQIPYAPFDGAIMSLVLEHISDLENFFKKLSELLKPGAEFCFSEIHPARSQKGTLAHFKTPIGDEVHLSSRAHTETEIETAALKNDFQTIIKKTICGNEKLIDLNPKWEKYLNNPMIQIWRIKKSL